MKATEKILTGTFLGVMLAIFATKARAATITVNSLNDPSDKGFCTLHDAIIAANTGIAINGCTAGDGDDTISFIVSSSINLAGTLPTITRKLVIDGSGQSLTIDGGGNKRIMAVASGAVVTVKNLTFAHGGGVRAGGR